MSCALYSIGVRSASICVLIDQQLNKIDAKSLLPRLPYTVNTLYYTYITQIYNALNEIIFVNIQSIILIIFGLWYLL